MQFHSVPERNAWPASGYPFLAEGSEDKKRIDAEQEAALAAQEKPKHDRSGRRRTRHHTVEQRGTS